jgi:hypothetical protein
MMTWRFAVSPFFDETHDWFWSEDRGRLLKQKEVAA